MNTAFGYCWLGENFESAHAPQRGNQIYVSFESFGTQGQRHCFQLSANFYSGFRLFARIADNAVWGDWKEIPINAIQ